MFTQFLRETFKGVSYKVGRVLGRTGLSPNFFTFLVLTFGLTGAYFILRGRLTWAIIFILISGIADFLDGAVAKANKKESRWGALFDSTTDKTSELAIYIALGFYNPKLWLAVSLAISFFMLSSYVSERANALGGRGGGGIMERKERLILILFGLLFIDYISYFLYIIAFFCFITCLQRFFRNRALLSQRPSHKQ